MYTNNKKGGSMIQIGNNIIVNTDDIDDVNSAKLLNCVVLTCGLKLNSTITASSISEEGFTFCIQRAIFSLSNRRIPQQEFNIKCHTEPNDIFQYLALVTILILCDVDPKVFEFIRF